MENKEVAKETSYLEKHVIIIGFGRVGKMVAKVLEAEKINYLAVDSNPNHVIHERKEGYPVYLGKGEDAAILDSVGIDRAQSIIITIDSEESLTKCTKRIRKHNDYIPIIGRAKDLVHEESLCQNGVTEVIPETYETGLQMAGILLKSMGIGENEVTRIKEQFRQGNYIAAHSITNDDEDN